MAAILPVAVVALLLACAPVHAQRLCAPAGERDVRHCTAALPQPLVQKMARTQEKSKWCWAASLSMIFARHGHEVSQEDIVREIVGKPLNVGVPPHLLARTLDREWHQPGGTLRTSARGQQLAAGERAPASVELLVTSLAEGEPLLLSADGHCLVVVGVSYQLHEPSGVLRLRDVTVIDPLPGAGVRPLGRTELEVSLLARIDVRRVQRPDAFRSVRELGTAADAAHETGPDAPRR